MVSNVRSFFPPSLHRRMATITISSVCILCCMPQNVMCIVNDSNQNQINVRELLNHVDTCNSNAVIENFDLQSAVVGTSTDAMNEGRMFLQSIINEINLRYSLNLSI